jgi:uncharacterized protein
MHFAASGDRGSRTFVLTFEPGDRLVERLLRFAGEQGVEGAWLSGIGAVRDAEVGWFDPSRRAYVTRRFPDPAELAALTGNLGRFDGQPALHVHVVLAGPDLAAVGGHLVEAVCAVTIEVEARETGIPLVRAVDPATGLRLLTHADLV